MILSDILEFKDNMTDPSLKKCAYGGEISAIDGSRGIGVAKRNKEASERADTIEAVEIHGVCMPSPCALGCSFDRELMKDVGRACGSMATELGFNAVISPNGGIVRSPLSGYAAERLGEDPYLCGELTSEWISGVQSQGCAAVLKGFLSGSQSNGRFTCDNIIDKRALREIYLKPFEIAVKKASPALIQSEPDVVNGLSGCENNVLNDYILRHEWGFKGAVAADLRLVPNCGRSMMSGVDVSMPSGGHCVFKKLKRAVNDGVIYEHYGEKCASRLAEVKDRALKNSSEPMGEKTCRDLSQYAAEQCAVLLKNNRRTLPMPLGCSIALVGRAAKYPRIQRGGMDAIPVRPVKNMLKVFDDNHIHYKYCEGWDDPNEPDELLLAEAYACACESEYAVVFVGLEDAEDNISFDRATNQLPRAQVKLINAVSKANPNTVVVIGGGALPKLNWIGRVRSVLYMPLCGEESCAAAFDLLFGASNPCGRLAVSNSLNEKDLACGDTFGTDINVSEYRESIYVGYRYYNKARLYASFPFGYGLSYTSFEYSKMRAYKTSDGWNISVRVKNIGMRDGAEIVQFYVEPPKVERFRPVRELKGFEKIYLRKGEEKIVTVELPYSSFAYYDAENDRCRVDSGRYKICAAASSNDLRTEVWISVRGEQSSSRDDLPRWYVNPVGRPQCEEFHKLFGRIPSEASPIKRKAHSVQETLVQLSDIKIFACVTAVIKSVLFFQIKTFGKSSAEYLEHVNFILNMPVDRLSGLCRGLYPMRLTRLVIGISNFVRRLKA